MAFRDLSCIWTFSELQFFWQKNLILPMMARNLVVYSYFAVPFSQGHLLVL